MKKFFLITLLLTSIVYAALAQADKKPVPQKKAPPSEMDKAMEEAMKGMTEEEKDQMRKLMKGVMPALEKQNATMADYPEFTSNKQLLPKKDPAKIASMSKKVLAKTEIAGYATGLYNKMLAKADATEMALVKKIVAQTPKAGDIGNASILAMMQGHPQAALALSIKAAQADPANLNWQNNMASLLTQYGYPEQAMPILRKLGNELPVNSTILNNLGQAWLGLGETDSAKNYFTAALRINPYHPEAKLCGGLLEELQGDPIKAGEEYVEALENSLNPFTEQLVKNNNNNYKPGDLDFEKIKKSIAIYEYFPKNWITEPPALSNTVKNYNEDYATRRAYDKMVNSIKEKIELMIDELDNDLQKTADKGEDEFVTEIANEALKGLSFMSKPAAIVINVLSSYNAKWMLDYAEEIKKLYSWKQGLTTQKEAEIKAIYKKIADSKGTTCEQFKVRLDGIEDEYMRTVNTRFREFLLKKTEEFRQWLNAYITWNWYVAGNIKNTILIQDLGFTAYLAETYNSVIANMETKSEHCSPKPYDVEKKFDEPAIPNFTCPAVVSIPVGPEWQQLVAAGKDFNSNAYGIKKTAKPVPNVTVAFGTGKMVAQPGMMPSVKTANGSISPSGADVEAAMDKGLLAAFRRANPGNKPTDQQVGDAIDKGLSDALKRVNERKKAGATDDDELTPLPKIPADDELVPLPRIPLDDLTPLDKNLLNKYKLVKELMDKMMTADCNNVKTPKQNLKDQLDRMMKKVKELEAYENVIEQIKKLEREIEQKEADVQKREQLKKQIERLQLESDKLDQFEQAQQARKAMEKIMDEMDAMDEANNYKTDLSKLRQLGADLESSAASLKAIQQTGLQPSLSSGLQAPGTFVPNKTLFQ